MASGGRSQIAGLSHRVSGRQGGRDVEVVEVGVVAGAVSLLALLQGTKVSTELYQAQRTGTLIHVILDAVGWSSAGETVLLARERHVRALDAARKHLESAAGQSRRWEFFAEELRLAQRALGAITGEVTADDLLGQIFSRFCIGK